MTSDSNAGEAVDQTADPLRWRLLGLLGLAQFMLILDVTVVAIALPHMGADLGLGRDALTWVVSAYTLAFGGLMLLGGRAADLFGPKPVVLAGLATFTVASLATGLERVAAALRAERDQEDELRAQLAGPRASALVLAGLPLFGLLFGSAMGVAPLEVLLGSRLGLGLLLAGVLLEWGGVAWCHALTRAAERGRA